MSKAELHTKYKDSMIVTI